MRSKVVQRILAKTSEITKQKAISYGNYLKLKKFMKTKKITIEIEIPLDNKQSNKWQYESQYIDNVVKELLEKKIRHSFKNQSGTFNTNYAYCNYSLKIEDSDSKDKSSH